MQEQPEKLSSKLKSCKMLGPCAYEFVSSNTGAWRIVRPQVDFSKCIKCGTCKMYCPAGVITIDKNSDECVKFMWDYCKGCGICANECPKKCIQMVDERSGK